MTTEEIIVLACSLKHQGRCVAGLATADDRWVRPVARGPQGELYPWQCGIEGKYPRLLDVVRFDHNGSTGEPDQPENVRLAKSPWERVDRIAISDAYEQICDALIPGPELLGSRLHYIDEDVAARGMHASLALVQPEGLEFHLEPHSKKAKGSPRAVFYLTGEHYDLPLTEFVIRPRLEERSYGEYTWQALGLAEPVHALLVVSLGTPYGGRQYKLVAAVLPLP